jgi:hypothetical protein
MSNYLLVFTIAKRREPFAKTRLTLVTLLLIGEKPAIRPVTPVLLVVNRSPTWYVYPCSVIGSCLSVVGGFAYSISVAEKCHKYQF